MVERWLRELYPAMLAALHELTGRVALAVLDPVVETILSRLPPRSMI